MPMVEVPLQKWSDIPALRKSKKFRQLANEALELKREQKQLEARRSELSLDLFEILDEALPTGVKSIDYEGAMLTKRASGKWSRFDKKKLMETPIPCSNPKCKADNHVTADIVEACTKTGESRPGVSVKLPGEENGDD